MCQRIGCVDEWGSLMPMVMMITGWSVATHRRWVMVVVVSTRAAGRWWHGSVDNTGCASLSLVAKRTDTPGGPWHRHSRNLTSVVAATRRGFILTNDSGMTGFVMVYHFESCTSNWLSVSSFVSVPIVSAEPEFSMEVVLVVVRHSCCVLRAALVLGEPE